MNIYIDPWNFLLGALALLMIIGIVSCGFALDDFAQMRDEWRQSKQLKD